MYGELTREEMDRVSSHLESCKQCLVKYNLWKEYEKYYGILKKKEQVPDEIYSRIEKDINRRREIRPVTSTAIVRYLVLPAACACLLLGIALFIFIGHINQPGSHERKNKIESAINDLRDRNRQQSALRRLIDLEADREVECLMSDADENVRRLATVIFKTVRQTRGSNFLKELHKRQPDTVESLVLMEKREWVLSVGKKLKENPAFLSSDEKKAMTGEILKDNAIYDYLKQIGWNQVMEGETSWFYLEAVGYSDPGVRRDAAKALGNIGYWGRFDNERLGLCVKALLNSIEDDNEHVRGNACWALRQISQGSKIEDKLADDVVQIIIRFLKAKRYGVHILEGIAGIISGTQNAQLGKVLLRAYLNRKKLTAGKKQG